MISIEQMALALEALPDPAFITASIGVTSMVPEDHSYEDTLKRADRALYAAKSEGRDWVVAA